MVRVAPFATWMKPEMTYVVSAYKVRLVRMSALMESPRMPLPLPVGSLLSLHAAARPATTTATIHDRRANFILLLWISEFLIELAAPGDAGRNDATRCVVFANRAALY